jgi:hypothetical protein
MLLLAVIAAAHAQGLPAEEPAVPYWTQNVSVVLGAHVVIPTSRGDHRLGFGLDGGAQAQGYVEQSRWHEPGDHFQIWAQERPDYNYGAVVHVWRWAGDWYAAAGGRIGVANPLRVGTRQGWIPGLGFAVEVAPVLTTAGYVGLDLAVDADLVWLEARGGATLTARGWAPGRATAGTLVPLVMPKNSGTQPSYWWTHPPD